MRGQHGRERRSGPRLGAHLIGSTETTGDGDDE